MRPVGFRQRLGQRQAQPGARHVAAFGRDAAERLERFPDLASLMPMPVSLTLSFSSPALRQLRRDDHLAAGIGEFDGVGQAD